EMLIDDLNNTIDGWIKALKHYSFIQLCTKPSPESWSPGQMYLHLVSDTNFYIRQIKTCISSNDNAMEEASPFAKKMFLNNDFPDAIIEGDPSNAQIPQPVSKEHLMGLMLNLKNEINAVAILISTTACKGKTKHPGFNYFSAEEWLQFADMHFRHHLRQKKRIDDFFKIDKYA
ncbi:MAG: DinB family protein, partial [Bacteroidota bacterium]